MDRGLASPSPAARGGQGICVQPQTTLPSIRTTVPARISEIVGSRTQDVMASSSQGVLTPSASGAVTRVFAATRSRAALASGAQAQTLFFSFEIRQLGWPESIAPRWLEGRYAARETNALMPGSRIACRARHRHGRPRRTATEYTQGRASGAAAAAATSRPHRRDFSQSRPRIAVADATSNRTEGSF